MCHCEVGNTGDRDLQTMNRDDSFGTFHEVLLQDYFDTLLLKVGCLNLSLGKVVEPPSLLHQDLPSHGPSNVVWKPLVLDFHETV